MVLVTDLIISFFLFRMFRRTRVDLANSAELQLDEQRKQRADELLKLNEHIQNLKKQVTIDVVFDIIVQNRFIIYIVYY